MKVIYYYSVGISNRGPLDGFHSRLSLDTARKFTAALFAAIADKRETIGDRRWD